MYRNLLLIFVVILSFFACKGKETSDKDIENEKIETKLEEEKQYSDDVVVSKPINLTKEDFLKKVFNYEINSTEWKYIGDKPAIIDFYADWCGPCKKIAPILDELAAKYAGDIYIYKINTDNEQELASVFGVSSIPTLLFIPLESKPSIFQGAFSKDKFEEYINSILLVNIEK